MEFSIDSSIDVALGRYRQLLETYHSTLDLVSPAALQQIDVFIEDSLAYARFLEEALDPSGMILDVGSGAGLPALPMAIAAPERRFLLVERRRRRATFLKIAISQLGLANAELFEGDVQKVQGFEAAAVTAQAVGSLATVYCLTRHLHAPQVWLLSRKGERLEEEVEELRSLQGFDIAESAEIGLASRGTLFAVRGPGGVACPP